MKYLPWFLLSSQPISNTFVSPRIITLTPDDHVIYPNTSTMTQNSTKIEKSTFIICYNKKKPPHIQIPL